MIIENVHAREILDSRGNPTVDCSEGVGVCVMDVEQIALLR